MNCGTCGETLNVVATLCPICKTPTSLSKLDEQTLPLSFYDDEKTIPAALDPPAQTFATQSAGDNQPQPPDALVGRTLAGRFYLMERIGEGGMGVVYKANHLKMKRLTAIKILAPNLASNPEFVARFQREARMASNIDHPNAVRIYDFGETDEGTVYMAMEFLAGTSLASVLKQSGPLPLERVLNLTRQAAEALEAGHRLGIVHRDFKPDNVLICQPAAGLDMVKVVDFGVAKQTQAESEDEVTRPGFIVGTPLYMSPEQMFGESFDARSDLYSLGIVVYQMLTGALPFEGSTPKKQMQRRLVENPKPIHMANPALDLPAGIEDVIMRALALDPDARYSSTVEFAAALERAARGGLERSVSPHPITERIEPPPKPLDERGGKQQPTAASANVKLRWALRVAVATVVLATALYFAFWPSPETTLARSLKQAVSNNQIVMLSGNDAYSYYMQLRNRAPTHPALAEVGQQILPQVKKMGDEIMHRQRLTPEKLDYQDWMIALNVYTWAHTIDPDDQQLEARLMFAKGEVARLQDNIDEAEKSYLAATQLHTAWALPHDSLGRLRYQSKRYDEALSYFQTAIDLQPNWEIPYNDKGVAYYFLGNYDEAEKWCKKALEKNPDSETAKYWLRANQEAKKLRAQLQ